MSRTKKKKEKNYHSGLIWINLSAHFTEIKCHENILFKVFIILTHQKNFSFVFQNLGFA